MFIFDFSQCIIRSFVFQFKTETEKTEYGLFFSDLKRNMDFRFSDFRFL